MDASQTQEDIIVNLHEHQRSVMAALDYYDGRANKQQIREFAKNFRSSGEIPEGSIYHHFTAVEDAELAEKVGQEPVGRGGSADVYELLPLGQTVAPDCREKGSISADGVKNLIDRVNEHGETIQSLEADVTEMKDSYEEIQHSLSVVKAHLGVDEDKSEQQD
jgi:hypothetical protein